MYCILTKYTVADQKLQFSGGHTFLGGFAVATKIRLIQIFGGGEDIQCPQAPTSTSNGDDCPRRKTPHTAPPCEELDPSAWQSMIKVVTPYDIKLVFFVQKITFVFREINKSCCYQSCTF